MDTSDQGDASPVTPPQRVCPDGPSSPYSYAMYAALCELTQQDIDAINQMIRDGTIKRRKVKMDDALGCDL